MADDYERVMREAAARPDPLVNLPAHLRNLGDAKLRALLEPLGLKEYARVSSYRQTEEIVYLEFGHSLLGVRPADGGTYRHYGVGLEHFAFQVDTRSEVDDAYERCRSAGVRIDSPPEKHYLDQPDEDYYAFFAFDPDGIRVEVLCDRNW